MADAEISGSITARNTAAREAELSEERSVERSADGAESAKMREIRTIMEGTGIVSRDWAHMDMDLWDHGVDIDDEVAPVAATTYIAHQLADYTYRKVVDDDHNITVDTGNGLVTFRSTTVKPYFRGDTDESDDKAAEATVDKAVDCIEVAQLPISLAQPRKRRRPPGSKIRSMKKVH